MTMVFTLIILVYLIMVESVTLFIKNDCIRQTISSAFGFLLKSK
ncbi:hypothetical protein GGR21_001408 [Dysgonomonas hofstadii]|uniref:Uncharacterized protein n=1 Tax=Dysgonomonas hofstadii TaxID=637886 RepID=A0A840CRF8_9BACT|nr:hypothetical protein [Dysgonomonas hofstadii]